MAVVQPYKGKATIEQFGAETRLIIPVRGKTGRLVFAAFFFVLAIFLVVSLLYQTPPDQWKNLGYLFFVTMGWVVLASSVTLLWNLLGREIISITIATVSVKKKLYGLQISRTYDRSKVSDIRVSPEPSPRYWSSGWRQSGFTGGVIAFDYGAKPIRCGVEIDEAEAKQILETLISRNLL